METFTASIWPSSRFAEHEDSCPRISPEVNKSCELHTSSILATPLSFSPRLLRHGFPQKDRKSTLSCSGSVRCVKSSSEDAAFRRSADHSSPAQCKSQSDDCTARTDTEALFHYEESRRLVDHRLVRTDKVSLTFTVVLGPLQISSVRARTPTTL